MIRSLVALTGLIAQCHAQPGACGTASLGLAASDKNPREFEAASVKLSPPRPPNDPPRPTYGDVSGGPGTPDPVRVVYSRVPLRNLIMNAYGIRAVQVAGPPSIDRDRYEIQAKLPASTSDVELCSMLQTLLRDRLALVFHQETREFDVYGLSLASGGMKMTESSTPAAGTAPARDKNGLPVPALGASALNLLNSDGYARFRANGFSSWQLRQALEEWLDKPVVDHTGLRGHYTFELDFSFLGLSGVFDLHQDQASGGVSIFKALDQQLGLKLERSKESLPILVIDSVRQVPAEN